MYLDIILTTSFKQPYWHYNQECITHIFIVQQSKHTTMLCKEHAVFAFKIIINCACKVVKLQKRITKYSKLIL